MSNSLDQLLGVHEQALKLRAYRQQVLASNLANADTPNFKARDFDFAAVLKDALSARAAAPQPQLQFRRPLQPSLDGNTVELDVERAQFAENALRYEAELTFLNAHIKTLLAALQG